MYLIPVSRMKASISHNEFTSSQAGRTSCSQSIYRPHNVFFPLFFQPCLYYMSVNIMHSSCRQHNVVQLIHSFITKYHNVLMPCKLGESQSARRKTRIHYVSRSSRDCHVLISSIQEESTNLRNRHPKQEGHSPMRLSQQGILIFHYLCVPKAQTVSFIHP